MVAAPPALAVHTTGLNLYYGAKHALKDVSFFAPERKVTALIGPSGCGKSSFLRCLNRMNDRVPGAHVSGDVRVGGMDPYSRGTDLMKLRREVGMLFQKANPFPSTIFDNVALAVKTHFGVKGAPLDEIVEAALTKAALWHEVKDEYKRKSALQLSGGQQQRLCLARMLAVEPKILLMDEPCSALDPISTAKIEELILELKKDYTVLVVTHNLQQAGRISDYTAFFMLGELIEMGETGPIFVAPENKMTDDYLRGRFG